jgi:hypothetical protein
VILAVLVIVLFAFIKSEYYTVQTIAGTDPETESSEISVTTVSQATSAQTEVADTTAEPGATSATTTATYATAKMPETDSPNIDYPADYEQLIPVVYLETSKEVTSRKTYVTGKISIDYPLDEFPDFSGATMQIRGRGNSTWGLSKKPYKIKLDSKTSLFGLTAAKDWVLLAEHTDPSFLRNLSAFDTARIMDNIPFVPTAHSVDVYMNGAYIGVYTLCEQVESKKGRIPLDDVPDNISNPNDIGYLIEVGEGFASYGGKVGIDSFDVDGLYGVQVKTPDYTDDENPLTAAQFKYIKEYFQDTTKALKSGKNIENYIDIDSFVDWFLVNELYYNLDGACKRSFWLVKQPNGKLKVATVWDYDHAAANYSREESISDRYSRWAVSLDIKSGDLRYHYSYNWISFLLKTPEFKNALKSRWAQKGNSLLDAALTSIDNNAALLRYSAQMNFQRWKILGVRVSLQGSAVYKLTSFDAHVAQLKDFLVMRKGEMDKLIDNL